MLKHPSTGRAKGRAALLTTLAGTALAAGVLAPAADAAFTTAACGGQPITARGASFQAGANQGFTQIFRTEDFCGTGAPAVTYDPAGSGAGRRSLGERGSANPTGARDNTVRIGATDEPPTPTQTAQMEGGPIDGGGNDAQAADNGDLHVIPVAVGANVIAVNFPDGCTPPAASLANDIAQSSKRVKLTAVALEKAFYGDSTGDTWGELLGGTLTGTPTDAGLVTAGVTDCNLVPVRRVVRFDDSGTTFVQKDWLNKLNGSRSPAWSTFFANPNTTWPNTIGESTASPCPVASNLCKNTSNGNGPLLDRLNTTDGGIGYGDISTARARGFEVSSVGDDTFWAPIVQGNGTAYEPTADPTAWRQNVGARGAGCSGVSFANSPSSTLGSWAAVSATVGTAGTVYPLCSLTYALAWDDYAGPYGASADNEAKARTAKDYLTAAVSALGQGNNSSRDYAPLPAALRTIAQDGVAAIGYDKTAAGGGGGGNPTPTPTPTPTPAPGGGGVTPPPGGGTTPPPVITPGVPSNVFTIASSRVSGTNLVLSVQVPGAGSVRAVATARSKGKTIRVGTVTARASASGAVRITIKASAAAKKLLRKASLRVSVAVTYTPTGGTAASKSKSLTLKKTKAAKKKAAKK